MASFLQSLADRAKRTAKATYNGVNVFDGGQGWTSQAPRQSLPARPSQPTNSPAPKRPVYRNPRMQMLADSLNSGRINQRQFVAAVDSISSPVANEWQSNMPNTPVLSVTKGLIDMGTEGIAKPLVRTSMAYSQAFGNLGTKLAGGKPQNAQDFYRMPGGKTTLTDQTGYTGTKKQIAGDVATNVLNLGIPSAGGVIAGKVGAVLPKALPNIIPKVIGYSGAGAIEGGPSQVANLLATDQEMTKENIKNAYVMGSQLGATLGGVMPLAGSAPKVIAKNIQRAENTLSRKGIMSPGGLNKSDTAAIIQFEQTAGQGGMMDDNLYKRAVGAFQKAGIDYRNPQARGQLANDILHFRTQRQNLTDKFTPKAVFADDGVASEQGVRSVYRGGKPFDKKLVGSDGVSLSTDKAIADRWRGSYKNGVLDEFTLSPDTKVMVAPKPDVPLGRITDADKFSVVADASRKGYDAVDMTSWGEAEIRVINPDKLLPTQPKKPQLPQQSGTQTKTLKRELSELDRKINAFTDKSSPGYQQLVQRRQRVQGELGGNTAQQADPLESLKQEARKYKSAEEFIKAQGEPLYHGTNREFDKFDLGMAGQRGDVGIHGHGIYLAKQRGLAKTYADSNVRNTGEHGGGNPTIIEAYVGNAKLYDMSKNELGLTSSGKELTDQLKRAGYDGTSKDMMGGQFTEYAIFDQNKVHTKQQLTDLYNQSTQKPKRKGFIKEVSADEIDGYVPPAKKSQLPQKEAPTPKVSIPENAPSFGMRQRGLATTILEDPNTSPQMKAQIGEMYKVRNTKDLQARAANLVKDDPEMAKRIFRADSNTDVGTMIGSELSAHLSRTGQHEAAIEVAQTLSREATHRGQANQALSAWGKLAPESVLRFTQHVVDDYNKAAGLIGTKGELKLTPDQAKKIAKMSEDVKNMADGKDKDIATKKLLNEVKQVVPASWVQKLSTVHTIGQLLNPKTMTRNILGNSMFGGVLENSSQVVAAGIDKGISSFRKTPREVAMPNLKTQFGGLKRGAKEQFAESMQGVNLGPETQFDLADVPAFRDGVMAKVEKTMGISLRVPDRAAFTAAYDDTVQGLMKANGLDKPTQSILDQAEAMGLYRTFQDNSKAAQLFVKLKSSLNTVGFTGKDGKQWGLGDLILKYPKTPGNILSRGIDYSPAGIVKGISQVAINAAQGKPFNQAALANSLGRGIVGTGALVGTGAALGSLGIITEKPSQDTDTRNMQKASGQGGYQINVSALKRFIGSGFDKGEAKLREGDTLVSYDWAQPASIPLSAGASITQGGSIKDGAIASIAGTAEGLNTLVEQPLISGVNTFAGNIKNYGMIGAFGKVAEGAPASFVPTASNQVRQLTDNSSRNTYDPNPAIAAGNRVFNRIPGLSKTLLNRVGPLGNNLENYQNGSNNIFNVAINPAFINKYQPDPAAKLTLDILDRSGSSKQIPTTTKQTQNVNGTNIKLDSAQNYNFQKFVGEQTKQALDIRMNDPAFMALSDEEKANDISNTISAIQASARNKLLGDDPSKTQAKAVDKVLSGNLGYTPSKGSSSSSVPDLYKTPNAEYNYLKSQYEQKMKDGKFNTASRIKAETQLAKAEVGSKFAKDIRDLYGLSKQQAYNYVTKQANGQQLAEQLVAYGDALVQSGLMEYNKFKDKNGNVSIAPKGKTASASKGRGGRKSTGRKGTGKGTGRAKKQQLPESLSTTISRTGNIRTKVANAKIKSKGDRIKTSAGRLSAYKKPTKARVA